MPIAQHQLIGLKLRDYIVSILIGTIAGSIQLGVIIESDIDHFFDVLDVKAISLSSAALFIIFGMVIGFPAMLILALPGCVIAWMLLRHQHMATYWIPSMVGVLVTTSALLPLLPIFYDDVLDELPSVLLGSLLFALLPGAIAGLVYRASYLKRIR